MEYQSAARLRPGHRRDTGTDGANAWTRVKQVLQEALERTPEERPAFLDAACRADDALRREVESLLAAHQAAGSLGERPAIETLGIADDAAGLELEPAGRRLQAGSRLGPYRIDQWLGSGGMGDVYKATDTPAIRSSKP